MLRKLLELLVLPRLIGYVTRKLFGKSDARAGNERRR